MKKILLMFTLMLSVLCINAQIATENSKFFDNVGIGITAGVSTPLDFNSIFPVNPNVGIKLTKDITPIFGVQIEGLAILNDNHFSDLKTIVKATNVGANAAINLSNALFGYNGSPRWFEVSAIGGLGWLHNWNTSVNALTAKTGVDLGFNLGKGHSLVLTPAVYWNLNKLTAINFNKHNAQFALNLSYIYHFKNSNGTHSFKCYDIGAMNDEINILQKELAKKPKEVIKYVEVVKTEKIPETNAVATVPTTQYVMFAKNSAILTDTAKAILDKISGTVDIKATASPEGTKVYNQVLSERRAKEVARYLENKGVKVNSVEGLGVTGDDSNRIAIILTK